MAATGATANVSLGAKGRVLIPVAVRRAAELTDGADLVVRSDGPGRIVVETREAVHARVWADAPKQTGLATVADVRAMRDEDTESPTGSPRPAPPRPPANASSSSSASDGR